MRNVLITGIGVISPLGTTLQQTWAGLLTGGGASCFSVYASPAFEEHPVVVGRSPLSEEERALSRLSKAHEPRFISLALAAAAQALDDAGLSRGFDHANTACVIGNGMGAATSEIASASALLRTQGLRRVSPFLIPRLLPNMAAGLVSIRHGLGGPHACPSTACASGANAVGDAFRLVQRGDCDVAVCGGTESAIDDVALAGFSRLKALSASRDPAAASRPFDKDRDGFVMAEGAAILVLESEEHFAARVAAPRRCYARVAGYGSSGDAFHITQPSGRGAEACMWRALHDGGVAPNRVGYVNAHATSTPLGDKLEADAIAKVLGGRVAVSSFKGATGHLLGAAGAFEAALTALAVREGVLPATRNLVASDVEGVVDLVAGAPRHVVGRVEFALSNSFGFGGVNASLLLAAHRS